MEAATFTENSLAEVHTKDLKNVSTQTSEVEVSTSHTQNEASAGGGRKRKRKSRKEKLVDMNIEALKEKCQESALPVTGTREQLIQRLTKKQDYQKLVNKARFSVRDVHRLLEALGVDDVNRVSCCLKAAIQYKFVDMDMDDPLAQIIVEGNCFSCEGPVTATLQDLLYQPDYGGHDYENHGSEATVKCTNEDCEQVGQYVTQMCNDEFDFDTGKFHNHCTECPRFGVCTGDYREFHNHGRKRRYVKCLW